MESYEGNITAYCKYEMDNDYQYYYFMKNDVVTYSDKELSINAIIEKWKNLIDEEDRKRGFLYIKGNYLFFTVNGKKYYEILSVSSNEWSKIKSIIKDFSKVSENVSYLYGELD